MDIAGLQNAQLIVAPAKRLRQANGGTGSRQGFGEDRTSDRSAFGRRLKQKTRRAWLRVGFQAKQFTLNKTP
jgi:hypothetical protein